MSINHFKINRILTENTNHDLGCDMILDSIQHMFSEGVALRNARVIEVEFRDMFHSDFFHDVAGANIRGHRDGHDFF